LADKDTFCAHVEADPVKVAIEGALGGASNPAVNIWEWKPILVDRLTNAR
jgi:hypothetical protein